MAKPTVLHCLGYDDDAGGIVSVVRALSQTQKFDCILGLNRGAKQLRTPALPVLELPSVEGEKISFINFLRSRRAARVCRKWLRQDPARVVHGHSRAGLLIAWWLRRWGESRCVASVHCYGSQRWFYRWMSEQFERRLFWLSPSMRAYYEAPGEGWSECVPGCISDTPRIEPRDEHAGAILRLGGVGALVVWKGWDLILDALALLSADERARIQFRHIGGPLNTEWSRAHAEGLAQRTKRLGLDGIVTWLGAQPSAKPLLGSIDALVIASHNEPFSIAMLESLFHRVPVLAADTGGARDIVVPPLNGWLYKSGDAQDLADKIRKLLRPGFLDAAQFDREELRRFTADHVAEQWLHIYEAVGCGK